MSKKKYIILFILSLMSIVFIYIKKIEIIDYFNGNQKELTFTIGKYNESDNIPNNTMYYYFMENYNGNYEDLKKIYIHIVNENYKEIEKPDTEKSEIEIDFKYQSYKSFMTSGKFFISDEIDIFEYRSNLSEKKTIIFDYISSPKNNLGLSGLNFFYVLDNLYILNKKDISVDDFTKWASFITNENIGIAKNEKKIYHLYNKDKSQHITMNCYDFCRRFDFIME